MCTTNGIKILFYCCFLFSIGNVFAVVTTTESVKIANLTTVMATPVIQQPTPQKITIPAWNLESDKQSAYFPKLLALAFAKTEATDGPVIIETYAEHLSGPRSLIELKYKNTIDVAWYGATKERMLELRAIKISLLKDFNQYRVLLIRKQDQERFAAIATLADLRNFTAGCGAHWSITQLWRDNALPMVTVNDFSLLFPMLKAGRFDYISRNIVEVWEEADKLLGDNLVIEQSLLLKGGAPLYFFVNTANIKLADRIERGLNLAIADGSFDELFFLLPGAKFADVEIKAATRRVIPLHYSGE